MLCNYRHRWYFTVQRTLGGRKVPIKTTAGKFYDKDIKTHYNKLEGRIGK